MRWQGYPNLANRPHAPAAGRGRAQRAVRRALIAAGTDVISTSDARRWGAARRSVRDVLARIAVKVGRAPKIGRPTLWKLKPGVIDPDAGGKL
jgi:hypothetical protein